MNVTQRNQVLEARRTRFVAFAKRITHNHEDAEDAVQTAWLKTVFYAKPLPTPTDVICMMYVCTRNAAYSLHRAWGSRAAELPMHLPGRQPDFDSPMECDSLLRILDERSRQILTLRHIVGLKDREIAEILGLQPGYIGVIALRAKRTIQSAYEA
jgi:RNA polymerase sigma factor (sigma-70 family)